MNVNQSLMKLIIKILILMILFVIIYMISVVLYSARYWPDVYNYVNSNISIKRIPTISELNFTVIEIDYTTESTTIDSDYTDASTIDFDLDEFTNFNKVDIFIHKRDAPIERTVQDYIELPPNGVVVDYMFADEETTTVGEGNIKIIKDLIDENKLTTRDLKDVEFLIDDGHKIVKQFDERAKMNENERDGNIEDIFPWIVTIFIKNHSENDQFSYYCDGGLLTETKILTAARCVNFSNIMLKPEDLLVVLGKSSLHQMADREKVSRISQIITHESFTDDDNDGVKNDLAVLIMDEPVKFRKYIKPTNVSGEGDFKGIEHSATTAWAITGRLEPIFFEKVEFMSCINDVEVENALCATYGYDVALCPSYGGLFAVRRHGRWQLEGIMSGDPSKRGICFNKSVTYTYFENYLDWIRDVIAI